MRKPGKPKGGRIRTAKEIAVMFGVTRQAVTHVEKTAINKLRERLLRDPAVRAWLKELELSE